MLLESNGAQTNELQVCVARSRRINRVGLDAGGKRFQWNFQVRGQCSSGRLVPQPWQLSTGLASERAPRRW